ncbi:coproporphyrinogen-III oxidase family protein [Candidatus Paraluminiphilus aquimaris]|nr:radical SAM protein [Candidatus Paraluminiphilus aquimaris]
MKWSKHKPPGLDDIFERHHSPHAIAGDAVAVIDAKSHQILTTAITESPVKGIGLYVHIPFCPSRCLSCDHLTLIEHDRTAIDNYLDVLAAELSMMASASKRPITVEQLHIGGGSPNYLNDIQLARLMASIHSAFDVAPDAKISMEINPRRTSRSQFDLLLGLGIRHLHLEVRDVDSRVQSELGRTQSFSILEDVFGMARDMNFDSLTMDLLFGLPGQTSASVKESVAMICELGPDVLVCQQYTRRPHQFPHQAAIDEAALPSLAEKLSIFNSVVVGLENRGYEWVGLNAFVTKGHALSQAQQNQTLEYSALGYSAKKTEQTLGVGIGAVSEVQDIVGQNYVDLDAWRIAIKQGHLATQYLIEASEFEVARRSVMRRLMCNASVPLSILSQPKVAELVESLESQGYAEREEGVVNITSLGRLALPHFWSDSSPMYRWL